ncbi:hypothetical protein ACHAPK_001030 [Fusarium culmorum]
MFRDKVTLLDFDMEEIRRLRPLIEWLKLQDRYLSNSVEEDSFIVGDLKNPISTPNRDLKRKAYHITRVAATFNSPRFEDDPIGLYEQLRTMKVVEVDRISSVLKIFQNKQPFEVHVATANEHIDDSTGGSRFMSRKIVERKSSVSSLIDGPIETEAVKALTAIFATERFVLDDVLDDQGILQVSFEDEDGESYSSETEEYQEEEDQEEESQQQGSSDSELETDDTLSEQLTPSHSSTNAGTLPDAELSETMREEGLHETLTEVISRRSQMSSQPLSGRVHHSPQAAASPSSSQSLHHPCDQTRRNLPPAMASLSGQHYSEDTRYRVILDRVIEKAQSAVLPSRGSFDMSDLRNALPNDDTNAYESFDGLDLVSRFRSTSQLERDKKVGAAGELYVSDPTCTLQYSEAN